MSIKLNNLYKLGDHLLLCADAKDKQKISNLLNKQEISLLITDPPYGVSYVENSFNVNMKHKKILNDQQQTDTEYYDFTCSWLQPVIPHLKQKNSFYIFNSDKMIFSLRTALIKESFKFSQLLVWIKNQAVIGRLDYLPQHELIAYGWYGVHQFQKSKDKSIIFYPKPQKNKLHPTMKPIGLLRRLILNSSKVGDVVYDPFMGSGSTILACEQTKRKCVGVEIDPDYCEVTIKRWEKMTHREAQLIKEKI